MSRTRSSHFCCSGIEIPPKAARFSKKWHEEVQPTDNEHFKILTLGQNFLALKHSSNMYDTFFSLISIEEITYNSFIHK